MSKETKKTAVPGFRFPEFKKSGDWQKAAIGEHLTESLIKGHAGDVAKKITVKLWGKGVYEKVEVLKGSSNTQYYTRKFGQFIYSKLDFLNEAFGIIPNHLNNYESTVDLPCFDVSKYLDAKFLLEYVKRKNFYKNFGEVADGGRKAKRIHADVFLSFPIFLPPSVKEQKKIADCLSSLDELITAQTDKIDALKNYKKGLAQLLFPQDGEIIPRLRFPGFKKSGEWKKSTLGEVATITSGGTPSRSKKNYWNGNIPWVTTTLIDFNTIYNANEYITEIGLNESSAKIFPKETILMAMYGQGKTRGKVGILGIDAATNQACAAILLKKKLNSTFLFQNLAGRYDEIRKLSNSGGQDNLSGELIKGIPFSHPNQEEEQQKIANLLSSLDDQIRFQIEKLEALKKHKKGLLQQLFPSLMEASHD